MEHHYAKLLSHMEECTYTHGKPSTVDLWNTTIPNQFHISKNAHIPMPDVLPKSTQPYYTNIVLPIEECRHPDIPSADIPPPHQ